MRLKKRYEQCQEVMDNYKNIQLQLVLSIEDVEITWIPEWSFMRELKSQRIDFWFLTKAATPLCFLNPSIPFNVSCPTIILPIILFLKLTSLGESSFLGTCSSQNKSNNNNKKLNPVLSMKLMSISRHFESPSALSGHRNIEAEGNSQHSYLGVLVFYITSSWQQYS